MLRVLVVDNWPDTADSLADVVLLHGFEVRTAYSGDAALRQAARFRPEVVLLDISLPHLNGCEVVRRLRQLNLVRLTIICVSGFDTPEHRRLARDAGCDHYLLKPVDMGELQRLLPAQRSEAPAPPEDRPASG